MPRFAFIGFLLLVGFASSSRHLKADNGTIVTGTVGAIDAINQIMRVNVGAVNGQFLNGNPANNFVDYLVTPNTVVLNQNFQQINQGNILVGSRIDMEFQGPIATTIMLLGNANVVPVVANVPNGANVVNIGVQQQRNRNNYTQRHNPPVIQPAPIATYPSPVHPIHVQPVHHPVSHPVQHPTHHPTQHPQTPAAGNHPPHSGHGGNPAMRNCETPPARRN